MGDMGIIEAGIAMLAIGIIVIIFIILIKLINKNGSI